MEYAIFVMLALAAIGSIVWWSIKNGISPMPTSRKCKEAMFEMIPTEYQGKVYELGSGWGTLLIPLARTLKKSQIIGYETSPIPYWVSRMWITLSGCRNVTVVRQNFFTAPLNDADLVVCYLYPGAMKRLKEKFERELKPGTLLISNTFAIPGWGPVKEIQVNDIYHTRVYLYTISV